MPKDIKGEILKIINNKVFLVGVYIMALVSKLIISPFSNVDNKRLRLIISKSIADIIDKLKVVNDDFIVYEPFEYWAKRGFYIIPNHFYQPIPDILNLDTKIFHEELPMYGVDMNDHFQLDLFKKFSKYKRQFKNFPLHGNSRGYKFHLNNGAFDGVDAFIYYSMIRTFKPKNIIEIGSGWSTKIAAEAALQIPKCKLFSIEPYPQSFLKKGFPGFTKLISKNVQEIQPSFFDILDKNDILFIDSSHTVKIGGDVNYLIFNILPRLKKGVLIHIHDIFFPTDYPESFIKGHKFWNEQYLIHAFLMFNNAFEVVYGNTYIGRKHFEDAKKTFSMWHDLPLGGSFWIRRK